MQTFLNVYFTSSSPACQIFLVDSKMFVSMIAALTEKCYLFCHSAYRNRTSLIVFLLVLV